MHGPLFPTWIVDNGDEMQNGACVQAFACQRLSVYLELPDVFLSVSCLLFTDGLEVRGVVEGQLLQGVEVGLVQAMLCG